VGVGVTRRYVVAAETAHRVALGGWNLDAGGRDQVAQPDQVVSPRSAPEPVEEALRRELSRLLGREARPVVEPPVGLQSRAGERPVGLGTPAVEFLRIE